MTVTANWNALSGNWFAAGNWNEPNPNPPPSTLHYVPGAAEDAVLGNNSGVNPPTPFTVTYNGTSTINSINGDATGLLDIVGGSLTLLNGGSFNSMAVNVGAGTGLAVSSGTLNVTAGNYAGTVSGAGTLQYLVGTFNVNAGASYTIANWVLGVSGNGTVSHTNLNTDLSYANNFTLADYSGNAAVLNLAGHTLTLSGTSLLDGVVNGPGTLKISGTGQSGTGYGQVSVVGGATLNIVSGGSLTQHHNATLGDGLTSGTLQIDSGATYTIDGSAQLGGPYPASAFITNSGTLRVNGAGLNAVIAATMTSTGILNATSGNRLVLGGGGRYTIGGTVNGAGKLVIGSGSTTLNTANVAIGSLALDGGNSGATLKLGTDLGYAGVFSFDFLFDQLQLNGHTLTLSGLSNTLNSNQVNGAGTLKITGAASIGANVAFGSGYDGSAAMTLENAGSITQTGNVSLNGTLQNDAGKTYTITAASNFSSQGSGATVINNGTFSDTAAGNSYVQGAFTNSGTLSVANGATLILDNGVKTLGGTISGAGLLVFGFAADATINTTNVTIGAIALAGGNGGATLRLGTNLGYAGNFSFANQFDTLQLNGKTLTLSGASTSLIGNRINGAGTLKITGAATIGGDIGLGTSNNGSTAMTLQNAGTITQTGNVSLNGTLQNDVGATYTIATASHLSNLADGANILNNGTFKVSGAGNSYVSGNLINYGTLQTFAGAALILDAGTKKLAGNIVGAGTLVLGGGADATIWTPSFSVAGLTFAGGNAGARLTLATDLTYGGAFVFANQFDRLFLNGHTLTLTGASNVLSNSINGAGTLKVTGSATVGFVAFGAGNVTDTPMTIENAGSIKQTGYVYVNGTLKNDAGKTYTIITASGITALGSGGTIQNDGTFADAGAGVSDITTAFVNTGTLSVAGGAILALRGAATLGGTVSGAGALVLYGNTALNTGNVTVSSLSVSGGTTTLGNSLAYGGTFSFNNIFATLALNGKTLTLNGPTSFAGGTIRGANGQQDKLVVNGDSVDLSTLGFSDWETTDTISITGTGAASTLTGSSQRDRIDGSGGTDTLAGLAGADVLIGGDGIDTATYYTSSAAVTVNLTSNVNIGGDAEGDTLSGIENLIGSAYSDSLTGDNGVNRIEGGDGSDTLVGRGGADVLIGGDGIDTANYYTSSAAVTINLITNVNTGGDAQGDSLSQIENLVGTIFNDTLSGDSAVNRIEGGDGNDMLAGRAGADVLVGGNGNDTATYYGSTAAVTVNLTNNVNTGADAQGDTLSGIENLTGSIFNDSLTGDAGTNWIDGKGGNDTLVGRAGADRLIGGDGIDTVSYYTSASAVTINLTTNVNTGGEAQGDVISEVENIAGSVYNDNLTGDAGANRIDGGLGSDRLTGKDGADTFAFTTAPSGTNVDTITDFTIGSDVVLLAKSIYSALAGGATPGSLSPNAFRTSTQASTSGGLGEIIYNATTGSLLYDADGSGAGVAKQFATLSTGLALSAASFKLA